MRVIFFSLDFGLIFLALVALLHTQGTNAYDDEVCRNGNCMSAEKCELLPTRSLQCPDSNDVCCSLVKYEFRTLCQHWGGECMDGCNEMLTKRSTDCPANQKCCVLVN